jgi:hypothetical protein
VAFLTRETFLDVVTSCNTRILLFPQYRDYFPEFKPHGAYVSSRFSEYVFQFSRMRQTNNVLVSVQGFMQHLRHYNCQLALEADTSTPGSVPPQQQPTVPTTNNTQPRPEPPETTDQQDGGLDDWTVEEEPASVAVTAPPPELQTTTAPATERPGQSDPVNVARRSAASSFQKTG